MLKNYFSYWKIFPNKAESGVCFKCMFYIIKVCSCERSTKTKDLLKDCKRPGTHTQMNCLEPTDIFDDAFDSEIILESICRKCRLKIISSYVLI